MMRSLFSGVAGLKTHQTKMDVVGNNIANVNTAGFKKSTVTFNEMLNQTLRGASSPQGNLGGTNPVQIGLGVTLGSIDVVHSAGSPQSTGRSLDMAIEGEGYFLVGDATDNYYTRAGNFGFDSSNNLVNSSGMRVKGWVASVDSNNTFTLDNTQSAAPINLTALASSQIMQATSKAEIAVNLDSRTEAPEVQAIDASATGDDVAAATVASPVVINLGSGVVMDSDFTISDGTTTLTYADLQGQTDNWEFNPATGDFKIKNDSATPMALSGTDPVKVTFNKAGKTYNSPTIKGSDFAAATEANPVKLNIGEGVLFNENFSITDGTNSISYADLKADPDSWELNSSTGELTIKSGSINSKTLSGTNLVDVNYDKADYQTSFKVYDNQGGSHDLSVAFRKTGANTWESNYTLDGNVVSINGDYNKAVNYKTSGQMDDTIPGNLDFTINCQFDSSLGLDDLNIKVDLSNMKQVASDNTTMSLDQNGFEPGSLQKISVNASGEIVGTFSNGQNLVLAQVAVATFNNPSGLEKTGNTMFKASKNSGVAEIGTPGSSGRGNLKPETLEMSNVDLSQEFVNMIITQRGFQANSRIITTSDEMLQELVNLKR